MESGFLFLSPAVLLFPLFLDRNIGLGSDLMPV